MTSSNQTCDILHSKSVTRHSTFATPGAAFTLVELLVVIGIIVLLISITIPVVGRVKAAAEEASTRALVQSLDGAIQNYFNNFKAYPGPIPDVLVYKPGVLAAAFGFQGGFKIEAANGFDTAPSNEVALREQLTGSENLVLGLLGGLKVDTSAGPATLKYDPSLVGNGPSSLNPSNPKRFGALGDPNNLSWRTAAGLKTGQYKDESAEAMDTIIPEFVDKFSSGPMPVLYLRARQGAKKNSDATVAATVADNGVINIFPNPVTPQYQQFDLGQIYAYTRDDLPVGGSIGQGKSVKRGEYTVAADYLKHGLRTVDPTKSMDKSVTANYVYPYDAYPYFTSPNAPNTPRNKDGYILISAGRDRVYGTNDDITNFGSVR